MRRDNLFLAFIVKNLLLVFLFLNHAVSSAHDSDTECKNLFTYFDTKPSVLLQTEISIGPYEAKSAGAKITSNWKPKELNQTYLYLIDDSENVWISPDYIATSPNQFIATHRSILSQKTKTDRSPILAAGQISVKNGIIAAIDNQSGTFRGDSSHLRYAHHIFKNKLNLDIPQNVLLFDRSSSSQNLFEIHESRRELLSRPKGENYNKTRGEWELLLKRLYDLYPDPDSPGEFHQSLIEDIWKYYNLHLNKTSKDIFLVPAYIASSSESLEHLMSVAIKDSKKSQRALIALENFLAYRLAHSQ